MGAKYLLSDKVARNKPVFVHKSLKKLIFWSLFFWDLSSYEGNKWIISGLYDFVC